MQCDIKYLVTGHILDLNLHIKFIYWSDLMKTMKSLSMMINTAIIYPILNK